MDIDIPKRHENEEDASPAQKEKIGIYDPNVLSKLGVHQANNIISFMEGAKHVVSHFNNAFANASSNTTVNPQVTDAITQAMGSLYQTIGNSVAMAAANAVYAQQANVTYQAASTMGVKALVESG